MTRRNTTNDATPVAIGHYDLVRIDGLDFTLVQTSFEGVILALADGTGRATSYTHAELRGMANAKRLRVERNHSRTDRVEARLRGGTVSLAQLAPKAAARLARKSAIVSVLNDLKMEGTIKFTEESVKANWDTIGFRLKDHLEHHDLHHVRGRRKSYDIDRLPCASNMLKMRARHARYGEAALLDDMNRRGGKGSPLDPEVQVILWRHVRGYMNRSAPSQKEICRRIRVDVGKLVEERLAAHQRDPSTKLRPVRVPCRATVSNAIRKLDRCAVVAAREGEAAARKKFRPVAGGLQVTRPFQVLIQDEHVLDIMAFIKENDWRDKFTDEEWEALEIEAGKDGQKARFTASFSECVATRCITGVTLTPTANAAAALQTLQMSLSDKGVWADAARAHSPWNMCGTPEMILTDCGSAYRSEIFRLACADLGIVLERTIAGMPEMRGVGERIFRTVSAGLSARMAGYTFGDIVTKGDRDPSADTSLTLSDIAFVLVRWVVDVYHNTPHEGLGGETPADCWRRLSDIYGVAPPPDMERFRLAFGVRTSRVLGKTGVTVLGVRYHSEPLAREMALRDPGRVDLRWHAEDIGSIAVRIGETWHTVPAVVEGLEGVHAASWLTAVRDVRAGRTKEKETDFRIISEALAAIDARNADAMLLAGVAMDDWSDERVQRAERKLFQGWVLREPVREPAHDGRLGQPIEETPVPPVVTTPIRTTPPVVERQSRRLEEDRG